MINVEVKWGSKEIDEFDNTYEMKNSAAFDFRSKNETPTLFLTELMKDVGKSKYC